MSDLGSSRTQIRPPPAGASSSGDSRTVALPAQSGSSLVRKLGAIVSPGNLDDQPTVISKNPLVPAPVHFGAMSPNELGRILEGERLGHFELHEFIGGGGMGAVFRALDTMLNRIVAVKVLSQDQASDEEALRRFKNEAQSAARLDHVNISRVYYVGEDRGLHYIVFEFIDGINLRDLVLQNGPLAIEDALSYTLQIADALDHASNRDVVHRDIKPSNILITPDGKAKVVDMGLARLHQIAQPENDLTESGVTLGTFDYISPEQARDPRAADVRSDLYSLGCTLYFLLCGRPPFPEGTVLQKLLQHQGDEPPDLRTLRSELPLELVAVVRKLMAKAPTARYQTPAELAAALLELSVRLGVNPHGGESAVRAARDVSERRTWQRHLPWALPLATLFMVLVVLNRNWSQRDLESESLPPLNRNTASVVTPVRPADPPLESVPLPPVLDLKQPDEHPLLHSNKGSTPVEETHSGVANHEPSSSANSEVSPRDLNRTGKSDPKLVENLLPINPANIGRHTLTDPGLLSKVNGLHVPLEQPTIPPQQKGILVVTGPDNDPNTFTTLRAACSAAQNNDVIELRFNGRMEEKQFTLTNKTLKIRAAAGFQPIICFRPSSDPTTVAQSMIRVQGGQLSLLNLALEMELTPEALAESWSLCEIQRADSVRLENCSLTIRNAGASGAAYHTDVAFFSVVSAPGGDAMMRIPGAPVTPTILIHLDNCLARGEATFLRAAGLPSAPLSELQPIHLQWDNGFLATSEHLWEATGGTHLANGGMWQIELRHLTALTRSGLCRLTSTENARHLLETKVTCDDCLLLGGDGAALLEQSGIDSIADYDRQIQWQANGTFYEAYETLWRIMSMEPGETPRQATLSEWRDRWGNEHRNSPDQARPLWLQTPESGRPVHTLTPGDFELRPSEDNPAIKSAGDGGESGALLKQLPALPPVLRKSAS